MKLHFIYLALLILASFNIQGQDIRQENTSRASTTHINLNVEQISFLKWNDKDSIIYKQVPGLNLGITSFQLIEETRIALLSDASNELIIINNSGGIERRFTIEQGARDFVFENNIFYVLYESKMAMYEASGKEIKQIPFSNPCVRISRYKNSTYLILPSGNCLKIETNGKETKSPEEEGWITRTGDRIVTRVFSGNCYYVKIINPEGEIFEQTFSSDNKVAGIFAVGSTSNRIILDLQTCLSETPLFVERFIVSIPRSSKGITKPIKEKLPDCYYVLSNKDLEVDPKGSITNMITSPDGIYFFTLTESVSLARKEYPAALQKIKYHFNNNLMQID